MCCLSFEKATREYRVGRKDLYFYHSRNWGEMCRSYCPSLYSNKPCIFFSVLLHFSRENIYSTNSYTFLVNKTSMHSKWIWSTYFVFGGIKAPFYSWAWLQFGEMFSKRKIFFTGLVLSALLGKFWYIPIRGEEKLKRERKNELFSFFICGA